MSQEEETKAVVALIKANRDQAQVGIDTLINKNAVAILYPYVRALVSGITNASNEYPALILPTINVSQILGEHSTDIETSD